MPDLIGPIRFLTIRLKLRESTSDTSEGKWLFPSSRKRRGTLMPLDYHNWLNRVLRPLGETLGIRVNHQILRRTFASLAYNTGGDLKDIQAQMRHASVNTTANIYTKPHPQERPESGRGARQADQKAPAREEILSLPCPLAGGESAWSAYRSAIAATKPS